MNKLYNIEILRQPGGSIGPWSKVWDCLVPTKIKCFTWLVVRKARLTHEAVLKRGIQIASQCFLCNEYAETNIHLFMHCKVTGHLWSLFFSLWVIKWTMPEHTADLLSCWIGRGGSKL
ncbi:hypothetical protein MTR67_008954 [Solanum verrucosum]|uniref:Reverse transcriptase zinc-binding domain-containing protein n=1 Tax=Solanum verrucosum TaxID=315347 RepID=A0AAF0Q2C4_SOLVR|nr:hypothetical protein MTR67_008954 [Solanum verrucosum]